MTDPIRRFPIYLTLTILCTLPACQTEPPPAPDRPAPPPQGIPRAPGGPTARRLLTPEQLQSRVRSFADQFRNEIGTACDRIKRRRDDPLLRQKAHQFKIDAATAVYDIAVDPSSQKALLNLLVLVTLQHYAAESHAEIDFPEDHPLIEAKTGLLMRNAWSLASEVMNGEQRRQLLAVIDRWWDDHDEMSEVWYVRLSDFAGYGQGTPFEGLLGTVAGLPGRVLNTFVPIGDATTSIDQATAAAERASWLAPRLLILAQWRAEAIILEALATTEVKQVLDATERTAKVAERAADVAETLPEEITEQREALFRDLRENEETLSDLLAETRRTVESVESATAEAETVVNQSEALVQATDNTLRTAESLVKSAESLLSRFAEIRDSATDAEPEEPGRPFDITEYTEALDAANAALTETNALLENIRQTTEPGTLEPRLEAVTGEGRALVDHLTGRLERLALLSGLIVTAAGIAILAFAKLVPARRRAWSDGSDVKHPSEKTPARPR